MPWVEVVPEEQLRNENISLFFHIHIPVWRVSIAARCIPAIAALMGTTKTSVEGVRILDLLGLQQMIYSRHFPFCGHVGGSYRRGSRWCGRGGSDDRGQRWRADRWQRSRPTLQRRGWR